MSISLDDILAQMTPERRARIERRTQELIREEQERQVGRSAVKTPERFEIYKAEDDAFRFRLVSSSGELLMHSDRVYLTVEDAREAIDAIMTAIKKDVVQTAA